MESLYTFITLMFIAALLVAIAQKLKIAYPIALVLAGAVIGFIPALKPINFDPNILLVIVLPPILYTSSFSISFREFRANWKEIFSLALGLVFITTLVIGCIFKWLFPEFPWPLAFAFGAIISPPDAVAASAILKRFSMNSRLLTILEGESLVNDASALVLYRLAVTALLSGVFSFYDAGFEFFRISLGGIAVGVVFGVVMQRFSRRYLDPIVGVVLSLTMPYMTYILANSLGVSGVLAVVTNGLIGSYIILSHPSPMRRIAGFLAWDIFAILLNCFIFILIGLQLKTLTSDMTFNEVLLNMSYGVLFTAVLIAVRMAWVYLRSSFASFYNLGEATLLGWSGMRGIVSLTAALALPITLPDGMIIDGREEVIFITFIVIMLTLLIPGFTLAPLIRWMHLENNEPPNDHRIRKELTRIAKDRIEQLNNSQALKPEQLDFLNTYFNMQRNAFEISTSPMVKFESLESLRLQIIQEQRNHLIVMWKKQEVTDRQLTKLEHELDLEETRMARAELK